MSQQLMNTALIDSYHRRFQYLRLSLTEVCNFRCQYCLPNGYHSKKMHQFLTLNEINHIINAFSCLGVKKIRLTGGEPTLRRDFADIIQLISTNRMIKEIAVTTNGSRLHNHVTEWKNAGLTSINVSVDSFSPRVFKMITGEDRLLDIINGIDKALAIGIKNVKVNAVLMKNLNDELHHYLSWIKDRNVDLRFIELMETGEGSAHFAQYHMSGEIIEKQLVLQGWQRLPSDELSGPAKVYRHDDYQGRIGLIMPYSKDFCQSCNRLRISSTGKLHYCLFGESAIELRDLAQDGSQSEALMARILSSLAVKPESHYLHQRRAGNTQNLSFIGG